VSLATFLGSNGILDEGTNTTLPHFLSSHPGNHEAGKLRSISADTFRARDPAEACFKADGKPGALEMPSSVV
jgi:hypothetical protein